MVVAGGDDDAAAADGTVRRLLDEVAELVVERLVHLVQQQDLGLVCSATANPSRARIPCE